MYTATSTKTPETQITLKNISKRILQKKLIKVILW